jgi:hypothetical protein
MRNELKLLRKLFLILLKNGRWENVDIWVDLIENQLIHQVYKCVSDVLEVGNEYFEFENKNEVASKIRSFIDQKSAWRNFPIEWNYDSSFILMMQV